MLIKPDHIAGNSSSAVPVATLCGNCGAEERRLLHHVRHRGVFRRLCTTCVLRLHPQSFCPTCFQVYPPSPPNDAVLTCFKCYSSSHSHCVAAAPSPYICPLCAHPNTPIFKLKSAKEANVGIGEATDVKSEDCKVMDRDAARKLLAAAKIASASMNKAAVAARAEAERRAKEAAFTRKRAKEALEHVAYLVMKEKLRKKEAMLMGGGEVSGLGVGGVCNNVGYPGGGNGSVKIEGENNVNVSSSNRNGSMAGGLGSSVTVEEKINTVGNVDRVDNSNQVLEALNAVELRENEKMGGITAQDEGVGIPLDDFVAVMDMDEKGRENVEGSVGQMNNENGSDHVIIADSQSGDENINMQGEKLEDVSNGVALVQPAEEQVMYNKNGSDAEQQANDSQQ
ncbi:hypothetical protein BUALT_Bualt19G0077300 [Buddleja alternifolia]|uniref:Uncharacterized protein n=1 Tax=Buddleja alternifolia TaxID=168488 RepID=A0AAV6W247_9LAMI|nr:hypothetical protein BUALT_Bualt19G0077300 [Buddleja alternifolia]